MFLLLIPSSVNHLPLNVSCNAFHVGNHCPGVISPVNVYFNKLELGNIVLLTTAIITSILVHNDVDEERWRGF